MINIFDILEEFFHVNENKNKSLKAVEIDGIYFSYTPTNVSLIESVYYNGIEINSMDNYYYNLCYNGKEINFIDDLLFVENLDDFKNKVDKYILNMVFL